MDNQLFIIIPFDGLNMGLAADFNETRLYFDPGELDICFALAEHWTRWINGEDV